jgi:hypothetical protein
MSKLDYLNQAIKKHGTRYKFCKHHAYSPGAVSEVLKGDRSISNHLARLIASDLAETKDEYNKLLLEIIQ